MAIRFIDKQLKETCIFCHRPLVCQLWIESAFFDFEDFTFIYSYNPISKNFVARRKYKALPRFFNIREELIFNDDYDFSLNFCCPKKDHDFNKFTGPEFLTYNKPFRFAQKKWELDFESFITDDFSITRDLGEKIVSLYYGNQKRVVKNPIKNEVIRVSSLLDWKVMDLSSKDNMVKKFSRYQLLQ